MNLQQLDELSLTFNPQWQNPGIFAPTLADTRDIFPHLWTKILTNRQILTLFGPRRTGKTYLLKQLIADLIRQEKTVPVNILYFLFNGTLNEKNIVHDLINLFLEKRADKTRPIFIFLDELQFIDYWQDQIKLFYDLETPVKFIITGSTSLFYRQKSKESLLGRVEKILVGGLSFTEYLRFKDFGQNIKTRDDFTRSLPILRTEFKKYLAFGQFPQLIFEPELNPEEYLTNIIDSLVNFDIPYLYQKLNRTLFLNLFRTIAANTTFELSLNNTAKELGADRQEITEYVKILSETGLTAICTNAFYKGMRAKVSANKKIYCLNSNLALMANNFKVDYLSDSRIFGQYFENYCFTRLREKYKDLEFYRGKNSEIDFITSNLVLEIKSGEIKNGQKYLDLAAKLKRKLVFITEGEMEETALFSKIPVYLL